MTYVFLFGERSVGGYSEPVMHDAKCITSCNEPSLAVSSST